MKYFICLVFLFGISISGMAAEGVVESNNGECPPGWREDNGFCLATEFVRGADRNVIQEQNGDCPSGYRNSKNNFCTQSSSMSTGNTMHQVEGKCLPGWYRKNGVCYDAH